MSRLCISIGGGGTRGILSYLLAKNNLSKRKFALGVGSSVGAIVVCMLAFNLFTPESDNIIQNQNIFNQSIKPSFSRLMCNPVFDGSEKKRVLRALFGNRKLQEAYFPIFILACLTDGTSITISSRNNGNLYVWQVLDAATAIPLYFPSVHIPEFGELCDLDCHNSDPNIIASIESCKLFHHDYKLISIIMPFTYIVKNTTKNRGFLFWIKQIMCLNNTLYRDVENLLSIFLGQERFILLNFESDIIFNAPKTPSITPSMLRLVDEKACQLNTWLQNI